jgi:hypothetical protein
MRGFARLREDCSHGPVGRLPAGSAELDRPEAGGYNVYARRRRRRCKKQLPSPRSTPNRVEDNAIPPRD